MLVPFLPAEIFSVILVFVRIGAAMMLLPGLGEPFITTRARLILALLISLLVAPLLSPQLPAIPESTLVLGLLLIGEVIVGVFIGTLSRMFIAALTTAGMMIAYMSSLANALVDDPSAAQQGSIAGSFLTVTALMIIFALDLHYLVLAAVINSYELFTPGAPLPTGDFSQVMSEVVSKTFLLSFQIAAPFVAVALIFYLGVGLLSRLMPQVQIFFVAIPLQILIGLSVLFLVLPVTLRWFATTFEATIRPFAGG